MKKAFVAMFFLLGLVEIVSAYEISNNPDRKISFGFTYNRRNVEGDYRLKSFQFNDAGKRLDQDFVVDGILPLNSFLSFTASGGYSKTNLTLSIISRDEVWEMAGYNVSAGIRVYLP